MSDIIWPERCVTENYVSKESIVADLTAAKVWPFFNDTSAWPNLLQQCRRNSLPRWFIGHQAFTTPFLNIGLRPCSLYSFAAEFLPEEIAGPSHRGNENNATENQALGGEKFLGGLWGQLWTEFHLLFPTPF